MKHLAKNSEGDWVVVAYATGLAEAEIVAGLLRSFEIPTYIQQEAVGRALGLTIGTLGQVRILVPLKFEQAAMLLLEAEDDDDPSTMLDEPSIIFPDDIEDDE